MDLDRFAQFAPVIRALPALLPDSPLDRRLLLEEDGPLTVYYAPFGHFNPNARVVLVGLTPGRFQAVTALNAARDHLRAGATLAEAARAAKATASFSGPLRQTLIDLLDHIGLHRWLQLASCAELFAGRADRVHYTSALRYPVFVNERNYSGTPPLARTPLLQIQMRDYLAEEVRRLPDAVLIPLGSGAAQACDWLVQQRLAAPERVLAGLPHPSGANAERSAYFLERKPRERLSIKTDPVTLDRARVALRERVAAL